MKNLALLFVVIPFLGLSQSIDVYLLNTTTEISGGTHDINVIASAGQDIEQYLIIHNNTGVDQNWDLERIMPTTSNWDDWSISWALLSNPLVGDSYQLFQQQNWITPQEMTVPEGDSVQVALRYESVSEGCDFFKYYILHDDVRVDSFNINICGVVGIDELNFSNVSIYPNPADEATHVSFDGEAPEEIKIFDILGSLIAVFESSTEIEVSTSEWKDGTYFLLWIDNGVQRTKKFQVSHSN